MLGYLQTNSSLRSLDLADCDLDFGALVAFRTVLSQNDTLNHLVLDRPLLRVGADDARERTRLIARAASRAGGAAADDLIAAALAASGEGRADALKRGRGGGDEADDFPARACLRAKGGGPRSRAARPRFQERLRAESRRLEIRVVRPAQ